MAIIAQNVHLMGLRITSGLGPRWVDRRIKAPEERSEFSFTKDEADCRLALPQNRHSRDSSRIKERPAPTPVNPSQQFNSLRKAAPLSLTSNAQRINVLLLFTHFNSPEIFVTGTGARGPEFFRSRAQNPARFRRSRAGVLCNHSAS
jgi:hypothetical protein